MNSLKEWRQKIEHLLMTLRQCKDSADQIRSTSRDRYWEQKELNDKKASLIRSEPENLILHNDKTQRDIATVEEFIRQLDTDLEEQSMEHRLSEIVMPAGAIAGQKDITVMLQQIKNKLKAQEQMIAKSTHTEAEVNTDNYESEQVRQTLVQLEAVNGLNRELSSKLSSASEESQSVKTSKTQLEQQLKDTKSKVDVLQSTINDTAKAKDALQVDFDKKMMEEKQRLAEANRRIDELTKQLLKSNDQNVKTEANLNACQNHKSKVEKRLAEAGPKILKFPGLCTAAETIFDNVQLGAKDLALLEDGKAYNMTLADFCFRQIIAKHERRTEEPRMRSSAYLPATQYDQLSNPKGVAKQRAFQTFVEATHDLFNAQDLYFSAFIGDHLHTGVVRNLKMSVDRVRKNALSTQWMTSEARRVVILKGEDVKKALQKACVIIIFDSDKLRCPENASEEHMQIAENVRRYLLQAVQYIWGRQIFTKVDDIDMKLYSPSIPQQDSNSRDCAPYTLRCIDLFLQDSETCCRDVLPLDDASHAWFAQVTSSRAYLKDFVGQICPHPVEGVQNLDSNGDDEDEDGLSYEEEFVPHGRSKYGREVKPVKKRKLTENGAIGC